MFNLEYSEPILLNCTFIDNRADDQGGAIHSDGDDGTCYLSLTNCIFSENEATEGGGMSNLSSITTLTDCIFSANLGEIGGAAYLHGDKAMLDNCVFVGNLAYAEDGGAIYSRSGKGLIVTNCTFAGNQANDLGASLYNVHETPLLKNCILWNDTYDEIYVAGGEVIVTYCNVQGGWPGEGNIAVDPCFVQPGYWDPGDVEGRDDDFWVDGDYHLKSQGGRWEPNEGRWTTDEVTSPCIDAGDPMSAIGLEPFPNGGIVNMGAYGGTIEASKSYFGGPPCEVIVAGDINGDCMINFLDFQLMALHWCEDNGP